MLDSWSRFETHSIPQALNPPGEPVHEVILPLRLEVTEPLTVTRCINRRCGRS